MSTLLIRPLGLFFFWLASGLTSFVPVGHACEMEKPSWESIQALVRRCTVQPFLIDAEGRKIINSLESTCDDLRKIDDQTVEFILDGASYRAITQESALSDGGDLLDVAVYAVDGQDHGHVVLNAETVLAFSDPILALALGNTHGITEKLIAVAKE